MSEVNSYSNSPELSAGFATISEDDNRYNIHELLNLTSKTEGGKSQMGNDYINRDVFDAHMQRIDQRFEAADKLFVERLDKIQAIMEKNHEAMRSDFEELKGEVKAMNARLDTIQQQYSWKIGWLGTLFTFGGAALAVYPLLSQYLTQEWIMAGFGIGGLLILIYSIFRR